MLLASSYVTPIRDSLLMDTSWSPTCSLPSWNSTNTQKHSDPGVQRDNRGKQEMFLGDIWVRFPSLRSQHWCTLRTVYCTVRTGVLYKLWSYEKQFKNPEFAWMRSNICYNVVGALMALSCCCAPCGGVGWGGGGGGVWWLQYFSFCYRTLTFWQSPPGTISWMNTIGPSARLAPPLMTSPRPVPLATHINWMTLSLGRETERVRMTLSMIKNRKATLPLIFNPTMT